MNKVEVEREAGRKSFSPPSVSLSASLLPLSSLLLSPSHTHLGHDDVFCQRLGDAQRDVVRRGGSRDRVPLRAIGQRHFTGEVCGLGGLDLVYFCLVLTMQQVRKRSLLGAWKATKR